jgi:gluconate 2-dehydrogenase gamma chain
VRLRNLALTRRAFLAAAAAAGAGCGSGGAAPGYRVLTAGEVAALEAWCDALIPPDQDAGAADAAVPRFIDIQLTRKFRKLLPKYRKALAAFALWRSKAPGAPVEKLLILMEKGKAPVEHFEDGGKDAFEMVLAHSMQGFYGSPRHGGNRDYASWRMLGVPLSPVRGREQYTIEGRRS